MMDPIVIDPPGFSVAAAWAECGDYVEKCGGLEHEDGEPNWRAAFGADPGVTSCPACLEMYWAWGRRQRCVKCGFEYETDNWAQYSWGVQDAWRTQGHTVCPDPAVNERFLRSILDQLQHKCAHPYYCYGYKNPPEKGTELYAYFHSLPWREIMNRYPHRERIQT